MLETNYIMTDYLKKYAYTPDIEEINRCLSNIAGSLENFTTAQVMKDCFSMMDLTSLKTQDTDQSILKLVRKVNAFKESYPDFPNPASICVFPNFAPTVKEALTAEGVHVTVVSACFPSSQSFIEVKLKECELAVEKGADEVDIVLALNAFMAGDYERASDEIRQIRHCIDSVAERQGRRVILKVIIETGVLVSPENIAKASFLAMESGADFIKTSTGKVEVNATPVAAFVMCECIAAYYKLTGIKVGFKPAGGMSSAADAACYYSIVATVLGKDWLNKDFFRLGVSRMANNLLSEVEQKTVSFF